MTLMAKVGRFGEGVFRGILGVIVFLLSLEVVEIGLLELMNGGNIVLDRKNNVVTVNGRKICPLDKAVLTIQSQWRPVWFADRFHSRTLTLTLPSRTKWGKSYLAIPLGEFSLAISDEIAAMMFVADEKKNSGEVSEVTADRKVIQRPVRQRFLWLRGKG
ncbi:MAG: hypothetical protein ABIY70_10570 [Capsulimonas sp.]|uniref:hypothetical protein n=1 Tax=Capsulimonas sp. TaxID=2494211 RepID=UPI0032651D09